MTNNFNPDASEGKPEKRRQHRALTRAQARRVLANAGEMGNDLEISLQVMEQGLSIAIHASKPELDYWEEHHDDEGLVDEFQIDDPATLPADIRFALLARVVRTVADAFGGIDDVELGEVDRDPTCVGTPVRELLAIVSGTTSEAQDRT